MYNSVQSTELFEFMYYQGKWAGILKKKKNNQLCVFGS